MRPNLDMKDILTQLSERLPSVEYQYGDLSDIGNEVGYRLGQLLENMTKDEIELFITGFKHGVSLTNGTH
jgi:hypothetical protein